MAQGQGFVNVTNGISGVLGSLFGSNGAADELAVVFNKSGQPVAVTPAQPSPPSGNNTLFIVIGIIAVIGILLMLKK